MEETLGKRIVSHRKRLGMTQDRLAEMLGVTAQAVSKWENDQSCPDIAMLPRLAEVFGISTDELLGLEKKEVHPAQVAAADAGNPEFHGLRYQNGMWEFQWDGGRKSSVGIALWVLLSGILLLLSNIFHVDADLWNILWPTGLLVFGLFGLYPKLSFFRLGCGVFGGYALLNYLYIAPFALDKQLLFAIFLLLLGLSLLEAALRKSKKGPFHTVSGGNSVGRSGKNYCTYEGERFACSTSFGGNDYLIQLPRLSGGHAEVSFGELTVNLNGCAEFSENCPLELNCSFGELILLVPRTCLVKPETRTAFGSVEVSGSPAPDVEAVILLECTASFGQITIRYL